MKNPRTSVTFDPTTYKQLKSIAARNGWSVSEVIREYTQETLNGQVTRDNVDLISHILREQLKDVMAPYFERIIALEAKACIQAGTAAYLSAEALTSFVPDHLQKDFKDAYEAARKKAVKYTRQNQSEE